MQRSLTRTFGAGLLALCLALASIGASATPAAANNHRNNGNGAEAAAVLGGLLLLYGLSQSGRNHGPVIQHAPPRPRLVAPAHCYVEGQDDYGPYRGYVQNCIRHHAAAAHLLPAPCLRMIYTPRGRHHIYRSHCLSQHGWVRG